MALINSKKNQDSEKMHVSLLVWLLSSPSTTMPYFSPHALSLVTHFDLNLSILSGWETAVSEKLTLPKLFLF